MPHYPVLRTFTRLLYSARKCRMTIKAIDSVLQAGDIDDLIALLGLKGSLSNLFSKDGAEHVVVSEDYSAFGLGCIERCLKVTPADLMAMLQSSKMTQSFPDVALSICVSVNRCLVLTCVNFSLEKHSSVVDIEIPHSAKQRCRKGVHVPLLWTSS